MESIDTKILKRLVCVKNRRKTRVQRQQLERVISYVRKSGSSQWVLEWEAEMRTSTTGDFMLILHL